MSRRETKLILAAFCCLALYIGATVAGSGTGEKQLSIRNERSLGTDGMPVAEPDYQASVLKRYWIPPGMQVSKVVITHVEKTESLVPNDSAYSEVEASANLPACETAAEFVGMQQFRGHRLAIMRVWKACIDSIREREYVLGDVQIDLVLGPSQNPADLQARFDPWTINTLKKMVENPGEVPAAPVHARPTQAASVSDSIPMVIITNDELKTVFEDYAEFKTKLGIRSEVKTVSQLALMYPADSVQNSVRAYIRDCYNNRHTDYVLLGGDIDVVPPVYVYSLGMHVLTDMYYSCLDLDWNQDGDSLFGEVYGRGDSVDFVPEVFVGRLPCSDLAQANAMLNKIRGYQTDTTVIGYQPSVLFFGTNVCFGDEAEPPLWQDSRELLESLQAYLPSTMPSELLYKSPSSAVRERMNDGRGLLVNSSMSQWANNLLTHWQKDPWLRDPIWSSYFADTMSNTGKYSVFFNYTCRNAQLEYPEALARHFMRNPSGGGVAYIGSSTYDWSTSLYGSLHQEMFDLIFNGGIYDLGRALTEAKAVIIPPNPFRDGYYRCGLFSFLYLGDPQMEIWTDTPKLLSVVAPDTLVTGQRDVVVRVYSDGLPVPNAKVCLWSPTDFFEVYEIGFTDNLGRVSFSVPLTLAGDASIVASKHNFFPFERTLTIKYPDDPGDGGGGCPKLYIWNGKQFSFCNNLLAHSEDHSIRECKDDAYPVYWAPVLDGMVRMRILEEEQERSWFNEFRAYTVRYSPQTRLALTDKTAFRALGTDSLLPVSALLNAERDITSLVSRQDGQAFISSVPGSMVITYVKVDTVTGRSRPTTSLESTEGGVPIDPRPKFPGPERVASDPEIGTRNIVRIYALDSYGNWSLVNTVYPRFVKTKFYTELGDFFVDGVLTIKLEWSGSLWLDYLPFEWFSGEALTLEKAKLRLARHSVQGDVLTQLSTSAGDTVTLKPRESLDLVFTVGPATPEEYVGLVLIANGRYETIQQDEVNPTVVFDQNYPNPFNPTTTFSFSLGAPTDVCIVVYNVLGQQVKVVTDQRYSMGNHQVVWDGKDGQGHDVATGLYLAKLIAAGTTSTRKILLLR